MAAGKLFALIGLGALAGVAFAGATTGAMQTYRPVAPRPPAIARVEPARPQTAVPDAPALLEQPDANAPRSWLDEGLSLLDAPAWPFGPHRYDPAPMRQPGPDFEEGYAAPPVPPGYDDEDAEPYWRQRGRMHDDRRWRDEPEEDDAFVDDGPPGGGFRQQPRDYGYAPRQAPPQSADAAASAARDAARAAQDVRSAEH